MINYMFETSLIKEDSSAVALNMCRAFSRPLPAAPAATLSASALVDVNESAMLR